MEHQTKWHDKLDSLAWKLHEMAGADAPPTPGDLGACADILFDILDELSLSQSLWGRTLPPPPTNTNGQASLTMKGLHDEDDHLLREHGRVGPTAPVASQNQDRIRSRLFQQALQGAKASLQARSPKRSQTRGRFKGRMTKRRYRR